MLVIWNERANPRRARAGAESAVMSSPAKRTRPRSGRRSPASWLISVVLPAPFGPMMAWVSPSRISRLTSSHARSAPKLLVRPLTSSRVLFILAEEQSREAALEEEHRQHQERPEDELPVRSPARERVLDQEQRKGADHRSGDARHAPEYDHEHKLARARPVHELGRQVGGVVDEDRPGEAAHGARDHERSEPIRVGRETERARSRLVRLGGPENEAEPGVDEPVPHEESEDKDREDQEVEGVGVVEVDQARKLALHREAHAVVAAVLLDRDAEVIQHLRERERDHDEVDAARADRDRADD